MADYDKQEYDQLWKRMNSWPETQLAPMPPAYSQLSPQQKIDLFNTRLSDAAAAQIGKASGAFTLFGDLFREDRMPGRVSEAITSEPARNVVNSFVDNSSLPDIYEYAKHPEYFQRPPSFPPTPAGKQVVTDYTMNRIKQRVGNLVKEAPFKNLPLAIATFLQTKGYKQTAEYAKDPKYFYGAIGLLALGLGGAAYGTYRLLKNDDDEEDDEDYEEAES